MKEENKDGKDGEKMIKDQEEEDKEEDKDEWEGEEEITNMHD